MIIYCKDRLDNKTIYKTNKAKLIDKTIYFISEGETSFMSDKQPEPMYIEFPDKESADDAMTTLYSYRKVDLTRMDVNTDTVADINERRHMTGSERADYATKVFL